MDYRNTIRLQKCLYFNVYHSVIWGIVTLFFIFAKFGQLDHLTKYLSVAVYTLLMVIECTRLYFGHYGNLSKRVPELAGFLMLTVLMQLPLVSFFLFNPYLHSTPTEVILNLILWIMSVTEIILGFVSLKEASAIAKNAYMSQNKVN